MANRYKDEDCPRAWKIKWKENRDRGCFACGGTSKKRNCGHSWRSWKYRYKKKKRQYLEADVIELIEVHDIRY